MTTEAIKANHNYQLEPGEWKRFVEEALDFESNENNVKKDFGKLSKKYGKAYIVYLMEMWAIQVHLNQTSEEDKKKFCQMNGNVPDKFFDKKLKNIEVIH